MKHSTRYEYQDDIVPHLPPDLGFVSAFRNMPGIAQLLSAFIGAYIPVGDLRFVNWQGQIVPESPALESLRFSHLIQLMAMGGWDTIISDHAIGPGSGVAWSICGPIWPRTPPTGVSPPAALKPDLPPGGVPF